jgi:hypothetical protein
MVPGPAKPNQVEKAKKQETTYRDDETSRAAQSPGYFLFGQAIRCCGADISRICGIRHRRTPQAMCYNNKGGTFCGPQEGMSDVSDFGLFGCV